MISMLELVTGNLLEADTEALVNAVNAEGVMGSVWCAGGVTPGNRPFAKRKIYLNRLMS